MPSGEGTMRAGAVFLLEEAGGLEDALFDSREAPTICLEIVGEAKELSGTILEAVDYASDELRAELLVKAIPLVASGLRIVARSFGSFDDPSAGVDMFMTEADARLLAAEMCRS